MNLLNKEIKSSLPPLFSQDANRDPIVYAKLFAPDMSWKCYIAEGSENGSEFVIYGFFDGYVKTWGQLSLIELQSKAKRNGLTIQLDQCFRPTLLSEALRADNQP